MTKPNFLFIGADRCGSKWLHNIFYHHPQCFVPTIADPYFFDKNYDKGLDWYYNLFRSVPPSAIAIGEFSHDYIHSELAAKRISEHLPDIRLLATLRHPVDRTFSSYMSAYYAGVIKTSFEKALKEVPMLINNSMYVEKLDIYFRYFEQYKIKILLYDELAEDPRRFARRAFDFVEVGFAEGLDYDTIFNPLSKPTFPGSGELSKVTANTLRKLGWLGLLGAAKRHPVVRSIFYRLQQQQKSEMDPNTRKELLEFFDPHTSRLEEILGVDLSAWRT